MMNNNKQEQVDLLKEVLAKASVVMRATMINLKELKAREVKVHLVMSLKNSRNFSQVGREAAQNRKLKQLLKDKTWL